MKRIASVLLFSFLFFFSSSKAQHGFLRWDTLHVEVSGVDLKNPWAGGLNFPQFSEIDLNNDGIKDLFVFDRYCNRILTFLNGGIPDSVDYHYAPQYESLFPKMHDFALLADYNCDNREDIFTYSNGGMAVYRNDFSVATGVHFTLMTNLLLEQAGTNMVNIYVSPINLPAFVDVDNDGDMDILGLEVLGAYVEYHKNLSKETYGTCDSLLFKWQAGCWGSFTLNSAANTANLGQGCRTIPPDSMFLPQDGMHGGACILALDLDGDGDKEAVIGDLGMNNLLLLTNGGSPTAASMIAQDVSFPANNVSTSAVNIPTFPCPYYLDVNNNGKKDLLVSPSSPNVSENFKSIWYYTNSGTNSSPNFHFDRDNLLQSEMIETGEGNNPVFFDVDADGLKDLLIGNSGYYNSSGTYVSGLSLYKNTGTSQLPAFRLITRDFANISAQTPAIRDVYPAFGDIDGDGDSDMLIGDGDGMLHVYSNSAGAGNPVNFTLTATNYYSIDVGNNAAPQIIDIDRDGKLDLVIGRRNGKISYYRNTGTVTNAIFTATPPTNNFLGGVDVVDYMMSITGYASPFLADINGTYKLFVGSERGYVYLFTAIDGNLSGNFTLVDSVFFADYEGCRLSVSGADIDVDSKIDLVLGNYGGGCVIFKNDSFTGFSSLNKELSGLTIFPVPASDEIFVSTNSNAYGIKTLEIYSITGQKILTTQFITASVSIPARQLSNGVYFCKLITQSEAVTGKFVITH